MKKIEKRNRSGEKFNFFKFMLIVSLLLRFSYVSLNSKAALYDINQLKPSCLEDLYLSFTRIPVNGISQDFFLNYEARK